MGVEVSRVIHNDLKLSQTDLNNGYEWREYNDGINNFRYIISDPVNRRLRTSGIRLVEKEPYEIPEEFQKYAHIMLEHQMGQVEPGQFEDHNLCGIYSDLAPTSENVTIGRVKFFDLLATFYSFPYLYRNDDTHTIMHRGSDYIYNEFQLSIRFPVTMELIQLGRIQWQ